MKQLTEAQVLEAAAGQTSLRGLATALGFPHPNGSAMKKIKAACPNIQMVLKTKVAPSAPPVSKVQAEPPEKAPVAKAPVAKAPEKAPVAKAPEKAPVAKAPAKLPTKSKGKVDVIQTARKEKSPHGYRGASGYSIYDRLASKKPVKRDTLVTQFCKEKGWDPKDPERRTCAEFSLQVVCNPAQKSNGQKSANACGGTLTKATTHVHLVAVEEEG